MSTTQRVYSGASNVRHPIDREWLGQWIQPHHLTEEALDRYEDEYKAASVPLLRLTSFLHSEVADKLHLVLSLEAEYEPVYCLRVPDTRVEEAVWFSSDDSNRLSRYSRLTSIKHGSASFNPLLYIKFNKAVADHRFIAFIERITGTPLGPLQAVGGKAFGQGDYLRPHHDQGFDRRIAFIFYLNPYWQPSFGGALHVRGQNGEQLALEADYNSFVVFDVHGHQQHYIAPIETDAGEQRRLTLGGWITNPQPEEADADNLG